MTRSQQPALTIFALGMIGLGILALIYGDFALVWQPVAQWVPGRTALAYLSGVLMLLTGVGLLFSSTVTWSIRILFPYLTVWMLLKAPAVVQSPTTEAVWLGIGELAVLLAGGWILFARLAGLRDRSPLTFATGENGVRIARILFAVSLSFRTGWAYLTGAGQIACGLGVLFPISAALAPIAETGMLALFTLLVWAPAIFAAPATRLPWTAFFISWAIAAAAWLVAPDIAAKMPARPDALAAISSHR